MIDKIRVLYSKKLPTKVAVAPREIKTNEKPIEKSKDLLPIVDEAESCLISKDYTKFLSLINDQGLC